MSLFIFSGHYEILYLHGLEFAGPEDEVAGRNLISESLANLRDAERQALACRVQHVFEIHEDALGGLRPQVSLSGPVFDGPYESLKHEVELPRLGHIAAAVGT